MARLDDVIAALREVRDAEATTELAREVELKSVEALSDLLVIDKETLLNPTDDAERLIVAAALAGELAGELAT